MRVDGQAAVVTGAASGLGAATARALAGAGAKVALLDRNAEALAPLAAELGGVALACDVTDADGLAEAFDRAIQANGPLRLCVNCAGIVAGARIVGRDGPMPLDDFARVIQVNLIGTFNAMRLAAARMAGNEPLNEGERGVIVNTASIAAFEGQIGQAAYAASKGGVAALTLPAARELARSGVRVAAIAPGLFGTPMMAGLSDDVRKSLETKTPFPPRLGDPAEFAALVLHIAGNLMLNGCVLRLDGAIRLEPK
ncbi:MAG: SDR family NAD(P)-dependent oxidoreductase [Alphaproteobacteria bacterium]|nr:SDR family NAD(P)-dependent oxidoreductase [Alphaproteobacteria bacterium]